MPATVTLHKGDCLAILDTLPADHFDAVVTDPPYHLASIVKRFGGKSAAPAGEGTDGNFARSSRGFMGKEWDGGDIAFRPDTWARVARVLKPGGHLVAFNHSRTWHRMAVAIEDSGFEIRDSLAWLYGTGFPKSHDVSKALDKLAGAERTVLTARPAYGLSNGRARCGHSDGALAKITAPASLEAKQWQGWGTSLKPAFEPIVLARKPLFESSIARQVLTTGTGALNIDAARIGDGADRNTDQGRWPANVTHDGSPEVLATLPLNSSGGPSVARLFYSAKANKGDRRGSNHPTVKPQALMQWLIRLICPKGGRILDPFGGSGSTGWAAAAEGIHADLIEMDPEYQADIARGIAALERITGGLTDPAPDALPGQKSLF